MFALGFAAAEESVRTLVALVRGEVPYFQMMFGFAADGQRHELRAPSRELDDEAAFAEIQRLGVEVSIDITVDHEYRELNLRCIELAADRRVNWSFQYEARADGIALSPMTALGAGWELLEEGFATGFEAANPDARLLRDALAFKPLRFTMGSVAVEEAQDYVDAGYASAIAVLDMFERRTERLATEVLGAFVNGDEVRIETFDTVADAIATQREDPMAGFAIIETHADTNRLTIRVPDPSTPERARITCEVDYEVSGAVVETSQASMAGDSPFEMTDFSTGFYGVVENEPLFSGWGKLGYTDQGRRPA